MCGGNIDKPRRDVDFANSPCKLVSFGYAQWTHRYAANPRIAHAAVDQGPARHSRRGLRARTRGRRSEIVECVPRGKSPSPPCELTFDASRHVVLPGLVNAHHHFYQTLTRAHPPPPTWNSCPGSKTMEHVWARMTPGGAADGGAYGARRTLLSGCTTVADHHNLFPRGLENAIDIEVEEARRLGIRFTATRGSMGISEKDGGLQPDSIVQDCRNDPGGQRARAEALSTILGPARWSASRSRPARRSRCRKR